MTNLKTKIYNNIKKQNKDIGTLYIIFGMFCGIIGTIFFFLVFFNIIYFEKNLLNKIIIQEIFFNNKQNFIEMFIPLFINKKLKKNDQILTEERKLALPKIELPETNIKFFFLNFILYYITTLLILNEKYNFIIYMYINLLIYTLIKDSIQNKIVILFLIKELYNSKKILDTEFKEKILKKNYIWLKLCFFCISTYISHIFFYTIIGYIIWSSATFFSIFLTLFFLENFEKVPIQFSIFYFIFSLGFYSTIRLQIWFIIEKKLQKPFIYKYINKIIIQNLIQNPTPEIKILVFKRLITPIISGLGAYSIHCISNDIANTKMYFKACEEHTKLGIVAPNPEPYQRKSAITIIYKDIFLKKQN